MTPRPIDNHLRRTDCPVCHDSRIEPIADLVYRQPLAFSTTPITLVHVPELWRCTGCESWFSQNLVTEQDAQSLYASGASDAKWKSRAFVDFKPPELPAAIRRHVGSGQHVVDIGCNTGELLDFCRSLGAHTTGVEPSSSSRAVCVDKGHTMHAGLDELGRAQDVAMLFDVIEHLYDVPGTLARIRDILVPGGLLVILTGDIGSRTARRYVEKWWYLHAPEHIVFPSREAYTSLDGFTLVEAVSTYASRGYLPTPASRLRGEIQTLLRYGNGLPLVGPDHHLLVLRKTA